jgi:hypothetical protein
MMVAPMLISPAKAMVVLAPEHGFHYDHDSLLLEIMKDYGITTGLL